MILLSLSSPLSLWYLDDATIAGPADTNFDHVRQIVPGIFYLGLNVNHSKSEIIILGLKIIVSLRLLIYLNQYSQAVELLKERSLLFLNPQ